MAFNMRKLTKYLAWAFLSICVIVVVAIFLAGSNVGVRSAVHFANTIPGIQIEGVSGSLYSQVYIKHIDINLEDGPSIKASDASIDIELNCLFDLAACVSHIKMRKLDIVLPNATSSDEPEASSDYISLPFPVDLKQLQIDLIQLFQKLPQKEGEQENSKAALSKMLSIKELIISDARAFTQIKLGAVNIDEVLLFKGENEQQETASTGQNDDKDFSLKQLKSLIQRPPSINIPSVFIPVNASLQKATINNVCWQVKVKPAPESCIEIANASAELEQQKLKTKLHLKASELLATYGVLASKVDLKASVNLSDSFEHELLVSLTRDVNSNSQAVLKLQAMGNIEKTAVSAKMAKQNALPQLFSLDFNGKLQDTNFPVEIIATINELAPIKQFLAKPFEFDIPEAKITVVGDWSRYRVTADASLLTELAKTSGLSKTSLSASISPGDASASIASFQTSGVLGDILLSGKFSLEAQNADAMPANFRPSTAHPLNPNELAVITSLSLKLKDLNLGALRHDLQSNINGGFAISHVLTEQWMQGSSQCDDLSGNVMTYQLEAKCDIAITADGLLSIDALELRQARNHIKAQGELQFEHTDYFKMDIDQLMASEGHLAFTADIADVSTLQKQIKGSAEIEGRFSGSLSAPQLEANTNINSFAFDNMGFEQLSFTLLVDAANNYRTDLELEIAEFGIDTFVIDTANIKASGDKGSHQAELNLRSKDIVTKQVFSGAITLNEQAARWRGKWLQGQVELPFAELNLNSEVAILADFNNKDYSLGDHCWSQNDSSNQVCLSDLAFKNDKGKASADVSYDVANIARHYSQDLILPDTRLPLTSAVSLNYSADEGLNVSAYNTIIGGEVETSRHMLELTAIVANITLANEIVSTALFAGTQQTGILGLRSQIALAPEQRTHQGRIRIDNFDLSLLQRFIPSTQSILGMVNADIGFDGVLTEPQLNGDLTVANGELILDAYTYPLTDFSHKMTFAGKTADMEGSFFLGKGSGHYKAQVDFAAPFKVEGELSGKDMQFAFSNSKAQVSPDINFMVSPTDLMLKGNIEIPSALVKVKELPENARTPSRDTIIIGQKQADPIVPLALDINLGVLIDDAERGYVKVDALDLEATLSGDLSLQVTQKRNEKDNTFQPLRTRLNGRVRVLDGNYEAYGQKLLVESGTIFFNGEPSLPQFDIRAIRNPLNTDGDVVAGLRISGNPVVPRIELFSEPPMTQARQLSYLLQGKDLSSGDDDTSRSDTALVNALIGFGVSRSDSGVGQIGNALGFDSLNLQTAGAGDNSQVQITGRIAQDIQITYGIGVSDQASEIILKYQIMPQLFIEAKRGIDSTIDLFYEISRGEFRSKPDNTKAESAAQ
jgi:translocation and assembly module TamB